MRSILVLLLSSCLSFSVKADIHDVNQQDLKNIKDLFEGLIDRHDYSYTIFGSKPMSLADFCLEVPHDRPCHRWVKSQFFMLKRKASWLQESR